MPMQVNPYVNGIMTAPTQQESPSAESTSRQQNLFQQILEEVDGQQRQADTQVQRSLLGKADLHEAMLALEKANLSLRTLVQVRNKLVQAYDELSRMPM